MTRHKWITSAAQQNTAGQQSQAAVAQAIEAERLADEMRRLADAQDLSNLLHAFDSLEFEEGRPTYLGEELTKALTEKYGMAEGTINGSVSGKHLAAMIAKRLVL